MEDLKLLIGQSVIEIKKVSVLEVKADAIVNAANRNLWSGGGICCVIFKKAEYTELTDVCCKIKKL